MHNVLYVELSFFYVLFFFWYAAVLNELTEQDGAAAHFCLVSDKVVEHGLDFEGFIGVLLVYEFHEAVAQFDGFVEGIAFGEFANKGAEFADVVDLVVC